MKYYYVGPVQGTTSTKGNNSLYKICIWEEKVKPNSKRKRMKVLVHLNIWKGLNIYFFCVTEKHIQGRLNSRL